MPHQRFGMGARARYSFILISRHGHCSRLYTRRRDREEKADDGRYILTRFQLHYAYRLVRQRKWLQGKAGSPSRLFLSLPAVFAQLPTPADRRWYAMPPPVYYSTPPTPLMRNSDKWLRVNWPMVMKIKVSQIFSWLFQLSRYTRADYSFSHDFIYGDFTRTYIFKKRHTTATALYFAISSPNLASRSRFDELSIVTHVNEIRIKVIFMPPLRLRGKAPRRRRFIFVNFSPLPLSDWWSSHYYTLVDFT